MKRMFISGLLIAIFVSSYSQNLDLVVTESGDSIACKIDSISESTIYFQIKTTGSEKWIHAIYKTENIKNYQFNCIDPSKYNYKNGTSKINGMDLTDYPKKFLNKATLENATNKELDFYLTKAMKTKKKGVKMSIAGPLTASAGFLLAAASFNLSGDDAGFVFGSLLLLTGFGITIVGIPTLIAGSSRVKNINKIKVSNNSGVTMKLVPCSFYNYQAQTYQPGVTLRIRF